MKVVENEINQILIFVNRMAAGCVKKQSARDRAAERALAKHRWNDLPESAPRTNLMRSRRQQHNLMRSAIPDESRYMRLRLETPIRQDCRTCSSVPTKSR